MNSDSLGSQIAASVPGSFGANSVKLRYTPDRPLILFTDFPPDAGGGANVIINSLLTDDEKRAVLRVSPCPPVNPNSLRDQPFVTLKAGSFGRSGGKARSWFRDTFLHSAALADEVAQLAQERNAGRIWVVLHYSGVPVGYHLSVRRGIKIHAGVNDDPAYGTMLRSWKAFLFAPWVERIFAKTLRSAGTVDATSIPMAARYRLRYGVDSAVTHRGLCGPLPARSTFARSAGELSVGILGNIYAYRQLPILGRAVAKAAAKTGAKGKILVLGHGHGEKLKRDMASLEVECAGHVPEAQALSLLGNCLAVYLNYPFGRCDSVLRQTSFPVKLSTYLLAGRPVLFHGPPGTSIEGPLKAGPEFLRHWSDMKPDTGADILAAVWSDTSAEERYGDQAEAIRSEFYDLAAYRRNLVEALNQMPFSKI